MRLGVIGCGKIAQKVLPLINNIPGLSLNAIASRDIKKANEYKDKFAFKSSYGNYNELYNAFDVDTIYIATPHAFHYAQIKDALEHNKNVICEKPLTVNALQAKKLYELAAKKNCFLFEAMWSNYLPLYKSIKTIFDNSFLETVESMYLDFSHKVDMKTRIVDPNLAGGALLDLGIYLINFLNYFFEYSKYTLNSSSVMSDKLIDLDTTSILQLDKKINVTMHSCVNCPSPNLSIIYTKKGYVKVYDISNPSKIELYSLDNKLLYKLENSEEELGYAYQFKEFMDIIIKNDIDTYKTIKNLTIKNLELMDDIKIKSNIKFPDKIEKV